MIGRLTGLLAEKAPPQVLLDVGGVAYEVDVPMSTFYALPATGERVQLMTHYVVREDAHLLFGFATDHGDWRCRALVLATGANSLPAVPGLAAGLPAGIAQFTAQTYRHPGQLDGDLGGRLDRVGDVRLAVRQRREQHLVGAGRQRDAAVARS